MNGYEPYRGKLHRLGQLRAELSSGLWLDQYPLFGAPVLWKDGQNIQFTSNGVQKISGWSSAFNPLDNKPIRGMVANTVAGIQYLFYGDQNRIYRSLAGSPPEVVGTGYTGNTHGTVTRQASAWSFVTFGSWVLATNGKDAPQILQTDQFRDMDTQGILPAAEIFMLRGPHVLAFGIEGDSGRFAWCHADAPEVWLPDTDNSAGSLLIRELEGPVTACAHLADRIAVYGRNQMFLVSYVGEPFIFGVKPALDGIGAVGKQAVVSNGRMNYGLGRQGFWETDGVNVRYIDDPAIKNFVQDSMNWGQAGKTVGWHDEENNQIVWYIPTNTAEPDTRLAFDYQNRVWSKGDHGFTSAVKREVFQYPVLAQANGEVQFGSFGENADDEPLVAWVRSTAVDLGEPDLVKAISALRIGYDGDGLEYRIGVSETVNGPIHWFPFSNIKPGYEFMPVRAAGRYAYIEVRSTALGVTWELKAIDFHGRLEGTR